LLGQDLRYSLDQSNTFSYWIGISREKTAEILYQEKKNFRENPPIKKNQKSLDKKKQKIISTSLNSLDELDILEKLERKNIKRKSRLRAILGRLFSLTKQASR
jgi:hypothetical protein